MRSKFCNIDLRIQSHVIDLQSLGRQSYVKMKIVLILLSLFLLANGEYIPGTPGGPWTFDELLVVRAKLWSLMIDRRAEKVYKKIPSNDRPVIGEINDKWIKLGLDFFPAKLVRLGFHDCVKYTDGTGGCDGCLNWDGMNVRFSPEKYSYEYDDIKKGNNNGLEYTVAMLEMIYMNKDFPFNEAPSLPESLKDSGKSRADLWAYAAKVAVEYSVERNNFHCENESIQDEWSGSYLGGSKDCQRLLDDNYCELVLEREINFRYGRKDCIPADPAMPYKATKHEEHPNPEGNGDDTLDFFKSQFNFSGKESVAILGAHTLGKMNSRTSLLKYAWTSRAGHIFNNGYYRNIVDGKAWFIEAQDNDSCDRIGDADGNIPDIKWVPTMNGFTKSGGPMHWIRFHFSCPNCLNKWENNGFVSKQWEECCVGKPEDKMCIPDGKPHPNERNDKKGCERYRFAFGLDDMTMNAEMGLYLQFDQVNGIPVVGVNGTCPGLKDFNMEMWKKNTEKYRRAWDHGCGLNMRREPQNDEPVSSYFEIYARNQATWVTDFTQAFEKMSENGYDNSDLHNAPNSWENIFCRRPDGGRRVECSEN